MKIGFVGMGKLGLPVAYTFASRGHKVWGYDISQKPYEYIKTKQYPHKEEGLQELLESFGVEMTDLETVIQNADMVFLPIQTPHQPEYEGVTRLPPKRADFDYTHLCAGAKSVADTAEKLKKHIDLVIISTVLPGTIEREIRPLLNEYIHLAYEPLFIAMGTVVNDVLNPEFLLCGVDDEATADRLEEFYKTIHNSPVVRTDINTAEGIKVFYNTFISTKIALANLYGEMAYKLDMDVDDIFKAITLSTDRILSPKYLRAGVGDGGSCHPRDNIALSWLAEEINLSHNLFEDIMLAREKHMEWIGSLAIGLAKPDFDKVFILGEAFKPETTLKDGSPAVLLKNLIEEKYVVEIIPEDQAPKERGVYIIGVRHPEYAKLKIPDGSIIIDPFRYREEQEGIKTIKIGKNNG